MPIESSIFSNSFERGIFKADATRSKMCIRDRDRIARVLFKQGVELAMLMHVVAATNDITEDQLRDLRKICVDEVKRCV